VGYFEKMPPRTLDPAFAHLLATADSLKFSPHRISHLVDTKGRHDLDLHGGFPFEMSLFHLREGAVTQRPSWHERLELLMPLDCGMRERMGEAVVELEPGDLLVVDHLQPHHPMDQPGLDTRLVVISFLPECVFSPGSPPSDSAFLLPFHRKVEGRPHILRAGSAQAGDCWVAVERLLRTRFGRGEPHREAGCKAWLLVLLAGLIREFRPTAVERVGMLKRRRHAERLKPAFDYVRENFAEGVSLPKAAKLCGMSKAAFGRVFKQALGMTMGTYVNQVRMTEALRLLEETLDPIAEIALRIGFCDQSHFDRRFRKSFGRTPSQHRALQEKPE